MPNAQETANSTCRGPRERVRNIAVRGSGGCGGCFGARLVAAGRSVLFFGRGRHVEGLQYNGLRVESARDSLHLPARCARATAGEVGVVDAVTVALKSGATETAVDAFAPRLSPHTTVFSL